MDGTERVRPSAWYYLLAAAVFVGALGITIFLFVSGLRRVRDAMVREDIPGQMDLELKRNETYTIFLEQSSWTNSEPAPKTRSFGRVSCQVNALPNGEKIPATQPAAATSYMYGTRMGISLMEFTVPHDGSYAVECSDSREKPAPKLEVAVGGGAAKAISTVMARSFFVLMGGIVVGVLIFARVAALRLASRKEIREQGLKPA
jgi:hypothetical protein